MIWIRGLAPASTAALRRAGAAHEIVLSPVLWALMAVASPWSFQSKP